MLHANQTPSSNPGVIPVRRDIRALLLDDSSFDRRNIKRLSDKTMLNIEMDEVDSIAAMDTAVSRENYDIILIDYRLPVGDGMKALDRVLQSDLNKDAAKIMITGDGARSTAVQALRGGYHDFLSKDDMDVQVLRDAMVNAMDAARKRQELVLQTNNQREIIREGLVAALKDNEMQGSLEILVMQKLNSLGKYDERIRTFFDTTDIEVLLAGMADEDEFVFH